MRVYIFGYLLLTVVLTLLSIISLEGQLSHSPDMAVTKKSECIYFSNPIISRIAQ